MKKILILLVVFTTTFSFSQTINKDGNGYTEVVTVDSIKKTEIYNKLKEWIGINYKSANDVIQLDSEGKIIAKGNFVVSFNVAKYSFNYRISNNLIFGVREGRFKIDLIPTGVTSVSYPKAIVDVSFIRKYISEEIMSKPEFLKLSKEAAKLVYINMGYNNKKVVKLLAKQDKNIDSGYSDYLTNFKTFQAEIKSIFTSIKDKVLEKDEW